MARAVLRSVRKPVVVSAATTAVTADRSDSVILTVTTMLPDATSQIATLSGCRSITPAKTVSNATRDVSSNESKLPDRVKITLTS